MIKPKNRRRLLCGGLALGLAGALSGGALAGSAPPNLPGGKTTVGVQTAEMSPRNLSYSVPLYVTVAAVKDGIKDASVVVPDGYSIVNTTGSLGDGSYPSVVVSKVEVQGVAGGTWSLTANPQTGNQLKLTVGGLVLPEVAAADPTPKEAGIKDSDNSFYKQATGYCPIPGGPDAPALELPLEGVIPAGFQPQDVEAAAQFRIQYTVSLLDAGGEPIGTDYQGPSKDGLVTPEPSSAAGGN